jgi:hypothetical protein
MTIRILDLDNCVSDDEWRIPQIDWNAPNGLKRYHKYHTLSVHDEVGNRDLLETSESIFIFTARANIYRGITIDWLDRKRINAKMLLMRSDHDERGSVDVKRAMLELLLVGARIPLEHITSAFDDRQDVVDMYKSLGIKAEVRAIHSTCAYTRPECKKVMKDCDIAAMQLYGMTRQQAHEQAICIKCKEEAAPKCHTDTGRREYQISGLCEECFDNAFLDM